MTCSWSRGWAAASSPHQVHRQAIGHHALELLISNLRTSERPACSIARRVQRQQSNGNVAVDKGFVALRVVWREEMT